MRLVMSPIIELENIRTVGTIFIVGTNENDIISIAIIFKYSFSKSIEDI